MVDLKKLLLNGLASTRVQLKKTSLSAVLNLALRPVISANFSDKLVSIFVLHILSVPGLVVQLEKLSPDSLVLMEKHAVVAKVVTLLSQEQQLRILFNSLEGSYALCLTANLVHLISRMSEEEFDKLDLLGLIFVFTRLLESCGQYVTAKQSNLSHWHPVLGWFSVSLDKYLQVRVAMKL